MSAKPEIQALPNGPLLIKGLRQLQDSQGQPIAMDKDVVALCRCGASKNKPFCDGSHGAADFSGDNERTETYDVREDSGQELTIVDDIGICCHAGECVKHAPQVFFKWEDGQRISQPDAADQKKVLDVVRRCPSGSLLAKLDGELRAEFYAEQEPTVVVSKDGPLLIQGAMTLDDPNGGKPTTEDHYALCRCGASKNKPFCDGAHKKAGFEAD